MICVSIRDVPYKLAAEYARKYPFVEFRLETLPVSEKEATALFAIAKKSIATCRPLTGQEQRRKLLLNTGLEYGADFVDIELDSEDKMLEEIGGSLGKFNAKLIISYHNFKETPVDSELIEIYEKAHEYNADIIKIACAVHTHEDNLRLLSFCVRYPSALVIGMGPKGRLTRLLSPFLGSPFTFACPDEQPAAAPGQLSYSRMKQLQNQIQDIFHGEA